MYVDDLSTEPGLSFEKVFNILVAKAQDHANGSPYTWATESILTAVRPLNDVAHPIYGLDEMHKYKANGGSDSSPAPHIYAVMARMQARAMQTEAPQILIATGESGTGKSFTVRKALHWMTQDVSLGGADLQLREKIAAALSVIELFGNAGTAKNPDSSRLCKTIKVLLDEKQGTVVGAEMAYFLLEESRVTQVAAGLDTNFRALHLVHALRRSGNAYDPFDPVILHTKGLALTDIEINDQMSALGHFFSQDAISTLMNALTAILHLGQIEDTDDSVYLTINLIEHESFKHAARLLEVEATKLASCIQGHQAPGRNSRKAKRSLMTCLYARILMLVVKNVNRALRPSAAKANYRTVAIVDLCGFEAYHDMDHSSEQFSMNFANELVAELFAEHGFGLAGAEQPRAADMLGQPCVTEALRKVLLDLEDLCRMPGRDFEQLDKDFLSAAHSRLGPNRARPAPSGSSSFEVQHYAGAVRYTTKGSVEKNATVPSFSLIELITECCLKSLDATFTAPGPFKQKRKMGPARFLESTDELIAFLRSGEKHWLRCLRLDSDESAGAIDEQRIREQLASLDMLQTIERLRGAWTVQRSLESVSQRYSPLLERIDPKWTENLICDLILKQCLDGMSDKPAYLVKEGSVYLRTDGLAELETRLTDRLALLEMSRGSAEWGPLTRPSTPTSPDSDKLSGLLNSFQTPKHRKAIRTKTSKGNDKTSRKPRQSAMLPATPPAHTRIRSSGSNTQHKGPLEDLRRQLEEVCMERDAMKQHNDVLSTRMAATATQTEELRAKCERLATQNDRNTAEQRKIAQAHNFEVSALRSTIRGLQGTKEEADSTIAQLNGLIGSLKSRSETTARSVHDMQEELETARLRAQTKLEQIRGELGRELAEGAIAFLGFISKIPDPQQPDISPRLVASIIYRAYGDGAENIDVQTLFEAIDERIKGYESISRPYFFAVVAQEALQVMDCGNVLFAPCERLKRVAEELVVERTARQMTQSLRNWSEKYPDPSIIIDNAEDLLHQLVLKAPQADCFDTVAIFRDRILRLVHTNFCLARGLPLPEEQGRRRTDLEQIVKVISGRAA